MQKFLIFSFSLFSFTFALGQDFNIGQKNIKSAYQIKTGLNVDYSSIHYNGHSSLSRRKTAGLQGVAQGTYTDNTSQTAQQPFVRNRRNMYSSMWAFATLNYLYADLIGLMDVNMLTQYQTGKVDDIEITPEFLTVAGAFMQIPMLNVLLPQIIRNDRALRLIQIISGSIMTVVQTGTLFVGEPAPYYVLFSAIEVATTACITLNAIKWKPAKNKMKYAVL